MAKSRHITFYFTDGTKTRFSFPKQVDDPVRLASEVEKALERDKVTLEVDGMLFIVPMVNVKYVQIYPAPEKLPPSVLKGASTD
jgi:hypothetical protein